MTRTIVTFALVLAVGFFLAPMLPTPFPQAEAADADVEYTMQTWSDDELYAGYSNHSVQGVHTLHAERDEHGRYHWNAERH